MTKPKREDWQARIGRSHEANLHRNLVKTHKAGGNTTRAATLRRVRRRPKRKQATA